jgi:hypothetical protein
MMSDTTTSPRLKKLSDLHREKARVMDMCEGTLVDVEDCIRYRGCEITHPTFDRIDGLSFALCIVDNKPAFAGDKLWDIVLNAEVILDDIKLPETDVVWMGTHGGAATMVTSLCWSKPTPSRLDVLREAKAAGKVILFNTVEGIWVTEQGNCGTYQFSCDSSNYMILEEDLIETIHYHSEIDGYTSIEIITSHIDGKKSLRIK